MDLNQFITPERIEQAKGIIGTLIASGGLDIITGAWNNKKVKRLSYILDWGENIFRKFGSLFFKIADGFKWLQEYGDESGSMDN